MILLFKIHILHWHTEYCIFANLRYKYHDYWKNTIITYKVEKYKYKHVYGSVFSRFLVHRNKNLRFFTNRCTVTHFGYMDFLFVCTNASFHRSTAGKLLLHDSISPEQNSAGYESAFRQAASRIGSQSSYMLELLTSRNKKKLQICSPTTGI